MRLADLDPEFLQYEAREGRVFHHVVDAIADAHGIMFLCPKCFVANGGPVRTHRVICWQPGKVPDDAKPGPGRWTLAGTNFDDLSLVAGSSSVLLQGGCRWHGFVQDGSVRDA